MKEDTQSKLQHEAAEAIRVVAAASAEATKVVAAAAAEAAVMYMNALGYIRATCSYL